MIDALCFLLIYLSVAVSIGCLLRRRGRWL